MGLHEAFCNDALDLSVALVAHVVRPIFHLLCTLKHVLALVQYPNRIIIIIIIIHAGVD